MKRIWFAIACVLIAWGQVRAEWYRISYGGRVIDRNYGSLRWANLPHAPAFRVSDWLLEDGELRYLTVGQKSTVPVIDGQGSLYVLPSPLRSTILYQNGDMARYNVASDTTTLIATVDFDSVRTVQGDSVVHRYDDTTGSQWLKLTLATKPVLNIEGINYSVLGFYDDTTVVLGDTLLATETSTPKIGTLPIQAVTSLPDAVVVNDTAWIVDGTVMIRYQSDLAGSLTYPSVTESVVLDSLVHVGDTLFLYGDFATGYGLNHWVLWSDTLGNRGIPGVVGTHQFNGTANERIWVLVDSARYAAYPDSVGQAKGAHCVVIAKTTPVYERTITGRLDYMGKYAGMTNYLFAPDDTAWINGVRDWDCSVRYLKLPGNQWYYGKIIRRPAGSSDSLNLFIWRFEGGATYGDVASVAIEVYAYSRLGTLGSSQVLNEYTAITLHEGRTWFAGSVSDPAKFTFSYPFNYDSINSAGLFGIYGDDPIVGTSSFPGALVAYGRHHIENLTGDIATLGGYQQQLISQVGAASNHVIARDPHTGVDVFCNEDGVFICNGASVSPVQTGMTDYFQDSVYWPDENLFSASVWRGRYWLSHVSHVPGQEIGGIPYTSQKLLNIDLQTGDVVFVTGFNPGFVYTYKDRNSRDRLFVSDADSTVLWEIGAEDDLTRVALWQSGWEDFGDRNAFKRINRYAINFYSTNDLEGLGADTVVVQFFGVGSGKLSLTALWADTVVTAGAGDKGMHVHQSSVGRKVYGSALGIKILSSDSSLVPMDIAVDVVPMGTVRPQ